jgi:hypothetical protein
VERDIETKRKEKPSQENQADMTCASHLDVKAETKRMKINCNGNSCWRSGKLFSDHNYYYLYLYIVSIFHHFFGRRLVAI